jgi:basic membrane protein A
MHTRATCIYGVLLLVSCISCCLAQKAFTIGFAMTVSLEGYSWTYSHELARQSLIRNDSLAAPYTIIPVTPQNTCNQTCKDAFIAFAGRGYDIVVCAATPLAAISDQVARMFPSTKFLQSTSVPPTIPENMSPFFGYIEQTRYLSGALAGLLTTNNKIAYLMEVDAVYTTRQLNAFYLGVRKTNSNATVSVLNVNVFNDPYIDRVAMEELLNKTGADTVSHHNMFAESIAQACSMGVNHSLGYGTDLRAIIGDNVATSAAFNWYPAYKYFVGKTRGGTWTNESYTGTLAMDIVRLSDLSPRVPAAVASRILALKQQVSNGTEPMFCGPLVAAFGPDASGCITKDRFSSLAVRLPGITYLGNAVLDTSRNITALKKECWNPPRASNDGKNKNSANLSRLSVALITVAWAMFAYL